LQQRIRKIDKRLFWKRDPCAGCFHGDSRNNHARRIGRAEIFSGKFFRNIGPTFTSNAPPSFIVPSNVTLSTLTVCH
jgi:hypothetical protein